ncbi:hypothetical protein S245_056509 [Arachis hypogaea]
MKKLTHLIEENTHFDEWIPMISHMLFADELLLFVEASTEQIERILNTLKYFCDVSGLKISVAKTSIIFSECTEKELRDAIVRKNGYKKENCIRRYLGTMITNSDKKKKNFKGTIGRKLTVSQ